MADQAEALRQLARQRRGRRTRVIAVTSGKGGVGKTNLTVNLGIALARQGIATGVLDADLGLANVDVLLGIVPAFHLGHVIGGERELAEILLQGPGGLWVVPGGSGVYELANLSEARLDRLVAALAQLESRLDLLLIDTGAGISRQVLSFLLAAPELIVVASPEPTSLTDAYGVIKVVAARNPESRIRVAVNLARDLAEGEEAARRLAAVARRYLGVELEHLGTVVDDAAVRAAVCRQEPVVLSFPASRAARQIVEMAHQLTGGRPAGNGEAGLPGLFLRAVAFLQARLKGALTHD